MLAKHLGQVFAQSGYQGVDPLFDAKAESFKPCIFSENKPENGPLLGVNGSEVASFQGRDCLVVSNKKLRVHA